MQSEEDCEQGQRYLFSDELFSDKAIELIKKRIQKRKLEPQHKGEHYNKFINWNRKPDEIALFTYYAYADFKVPKQFNCLFNTKNPYEFIRADFTLTQCLYEGFLPNDAVDHGHKHICIFEFENKIPEIVNKLHITEGERFTYPDNRFMIGICNFNDLKAIQQQITNNLKKRR